MVDTLLLRPSLHFTPLHFFLFKLHPTTLHYPPIWLMFRLLWGARWRSWLRHSATNRKVAASIPDGVIGIFH